MNGDFICLETGKSTSKNGVFCSRFNQPKLDTLPWEQVVSETNGWTPKNAKLSLRTQQTDLRFDHRNLYFDCLSGYKRKHESTEPSNRYIETGWPPARDVSGWILWVYRGNNYLVGGRAAPLKTMSLSLGMMTFPTEWKSHKIHVPKHQPAK